MNHQLEIDGVTLYFGERNILNSIYLKSETGKITVLLGRNGSGKTSLFRCVFGELKPLNMSVRIDGQHINQFKNNFTSISYLPQFSFIPGRLKVLNVFDHFDLNTEHFLSLFPDFIPLMNSRINTLSGGQVRIVETYAVIKSKSLFCILDEPFSHLMPLTVDIFLKLIIEEKQNKGIIINDHMYRYVIDLYDDLYLLKDGRCIKLKEVEELVQLGYLNRI